MAEEDMPVCRFCGCLITYNVGWKVVSSEDEEVDYFCSVSKGSHSPESESSSLCQCKDPFHGHPVTWSAKNQRERTNVVDRPPLHAVIGHAVLDILYPDIGRGSFLVEIGAMVEKAIMKNGYIIVDIDKLQTYEFNAGWKAAMEQSNPPGVNSSGS